MRSGSRSSAQTLIDLQVVDSRIAGLEARGWPSSPQQIAAIHAAVDDARKVVDGLKARVDAAERDQRAREKDLEDNRVKRAEVRGAALPGQDQQGVLRGPRRDRGGQAGEVPHRGGHPRPHGDPGARSPPSSRTPRRDWKQREREGQSEEATLLEKLRGVEAELAVVASERAELARQLHRAVLADYDRILRHRGLAVAEVTKPNFCGGCRVTITPQRLQELRPQSAPDPLRVLRPLPLLAPPDARPPPPRATAR